MNTGKTLFTQLMDFCLGARSIYAEFAQRLIAQARRLHADESLGMDLTHTVYALDSTTIDLCMSVFLRGPVSGPPNRR
jgi:hypothetical protein